MALFRRTTFHDGWSGMLLVIGIVVVAGLYNRLSAQTLDLLIGGMLLLAAAVIGFVLLSHYRHVQHEKQKLRALNLIDTNYMDGLVFEKYVVELLKSQGYRKVTLTERYDLGVDIIATKNGVRWGVQVKRYSNMVRAEAVRQVVTALNKYKCQRAMVVTNSTFSRPAKILAESNDCVLIAKDELAEWIIAFQEGK